MGLLQRYDEILTALLVGLLRRCLDGLRSRLQELGARRVRHGGGWYWELKPDLEPGEVFTL